MENEFREFSERLVDVFRPFHQRAVEAESLLQEMKAELSAERQKYLQACKENTELRARIQSMENENILRAKCGGNFNKDTKKGSST
ncbi:hypothetical protein FN846DRAFT_911890 [Sphaerosporella brunnea]|uniref:Uncharacterized protein n=1 Tax=Sphaerosporella brunnea TaxID=1250544 RepID=A0A5J5EJH9_9PEZI|nr:hypothetical protein FN846DRAFT_911890 [Sphaerosporella brunnea]